PGPNDGAPSIDAAVTQLQTALLAGKGRELLAVIYPDDRTTFGVVMATVLVFTPLAYMDDPKTGEKIQKEVDALLAKHKVAAPLNRPPAEIFKDTDLAAFLTDTMSYL